MKGNLRNTVFLLLRIGFGILLISASIDKILHPFDFSLAVDNYRLFGETLSRWAAVFMPYLELLTGLCLLFGVWQDAAIPMNAVLMSLFLVMVLQAFFRHLDIHCGCFTPRGESKIDAWKITENVLFALGSMLLWFLFHQNSRSNRQ